MSPPPAVGVVGGGTLGRTVAQAALAAGSRVVLVTRGRPGRRDELCAALARSVEREVHAGRMSAEQEQQCLQRLECTDELGRLGDLDVVVESVPEDLDVKRAVLAAVERVVRPECLLASTTSSIPARLLAAGARHPERIAVAHYVWPAHRIPLVEVAEHDRTSASARARLDDLLTRQGKYVVRVVDRPGFLLTRALFAYWDAAVELVRSGLRPSAVDAALESFGWPMGPCRVMDAAGLATVVRVHARLAPDLDRELAGLAALAALTTAGEPGFYRHHDGDRDDSHAYALLRASGRDGARAVDPREVVTRTMTALAEEVDRAVTAGVVASWPVAGAAIDLAFGVPRSHGGLHHWWTRHRSATTRPAGHPTPLSPVCRGAAAS